MSKKIGKTQSVSREFNTKYVIDLLKNQDYSATELTDLLSLSSATISSIVKDLLALNFIKVKSTFSNNGLGRKRVVYSINDKFGYVLSVAIANHTVTLGLANICEKIVDQITFDVEKYDSKAIEMIADESKKLVNKNDALSLLKDIIISLPGRVNENTGELMLSAQFDPDLFKEKFYIQNVFKKHFPNVECFVGNDINISCLGEKRFGKLKDTKNAMYLYIDTGIGGSFVINGNLFTGDNGYAGEFGLIGVKSSDNQIGFLDDFVSLRVLCEEAKALTKNPNLRVRELEKTFYENEVFHQLVLDRAKLIGKSISTLVHIVDIEKIIIAGRAINFGSEYINTIRSSLNNDVYKIQIDFSNNVEFQTLGAVSLAVEYIFRNIVRR